MKQLKSVLRVCWLRCHSARNYPWDGTCA